MCGLPEESSAIDVYLPASPAESAVCMLQPGVNPTASDGMLNAIVSASIPMHCNLIMFFIFFPPSFQYIPHIRRVRSIVGKPESIAYIYPSVPRNLTLIYAVQRIACVPRIRDVVGKPQRISDIYSPVSGAVTVLRYAKLDCNTGI